MRTEFRPFHQLNRIVVTLLLLCPTSILLCGIVGCIQDEGINFNDYSYIQYSTVFDKRFRFAISNALYDKLPHWTPASDTHPPMTPGAAIKLASQHVKSFSIDDRFRWEFDRLELKQVGANDKWIYIVVFKYIAKNVVATTGFPQTIGFPVTLDGKLIEPVEVEAD